MSDRAGSGALERRHKPQSPDTPWEERWWFDWAGDGWGGYVRLAFRPFEGVAWFWAAVVGAPGQDHPLVAFRAHDLRIPTTGTDVRGDGIWASVTCETPNEHWSVGLESFGVSLEDPLEAWRGERGDVVPFGLDLDWEAIQPPTSIDDGYDQRCEVHGEVLIGDNRLPVDAVGWREHAWGGPEAKPKWRAAMCPRPAELVTEWGENCLPRSATIDGRVLNPVYLSPVLVPGAAVVHALCRAEGEVGTWVTWWA